MEKKISGSIWSMLNLSLFLLLIAIGMLAPLSHAVDDKCAACKAVAVTSLFSFIPNRFIFHSALSIVQWIIYHRFDSIVSDLIWSDFVLQGELEIGLSSVYTCFYFISIQFTCVCNILYYDPFIAFAFTQEKPRNHLDMRHRLDSKGQRQGKLIDYRYIIYRINLHLGTSLMD
jgi:hypothetical protein